MEKKTVVIDMDEVITFGGLLHLINEYSGTSYTEEDFKDYYMQDKIDDKEKFFEFFLKHNHYDYAKINDNALEVIEELCKEYEVFIGTAYIFNEIEKESGILLKYKYDFLYKHLPFIKPKNYIFVGNKSILKCDVFIDDKIVNLKGGDMKLLYSAYHNLDISNEELEKEGIIRVNNWNDIRNILLGGKK